MAKLGDFEIKFWFYLLVLCPHEVISQLLGEYDVWTMQSWGVRDRTRQRCLIGYQNAVNAVLQMYFGHY